MSMHVDIGSATVSVTWNVNKGEPAYAIEVEVSDDCPLGQGDALMALAGAARRMAVEIEKANE